MLTVTAFSFRGIWILFNAYTNQHGAMVARGDLGAELPVECVPFWQSAIVQV